MDERNDFPSLYVVADRAAASTQRMHLWLLRANYGLILVGAAMSVVASSVDGVRVAAAVVSAILLVLGMTASIIQKTLKPDKQWFGARAVAESVKTLTWRYMTHTRPFGVELLPAEADRGFCSSVLAVLKERKELGGTLAGTTESGQLITDKMRTIRASTTEERRGIYKEQRVANQLSWYGNRATTNKRSATRWFLAATLSQLLAAITAILLVVNPGWKVNLVALLATLATVFLSWTQAKRHEDLSTSYALAAHELSGALAQFGHAMTDAEFEQFVADVEQAISREHTMWVARRVSP